VRSNILGLLNSIYQHQHKFNEAGDLDIAQIEWIRMVDIDFTIKKFVAFVICLESCVYA
jgi:hypothetical protein